MKCKIVAEIEINDYDIEEWGEMLAEDLWCGYRPCGKQLAKQKLLNKIENLSIDNALELLRDVYTDGIDMDWLDIDDRNKLAQKVTQIAKQELYKKINSYFED